MKVIGVNCFETQCIYTRRLKAKALQLQPNK